MKSTTDKKVNAWPLERRGVLLSVVVHAALLGILFFAVPDGTLRDITPADPVEVFFFHDPVNPEVSLPAIQELAQVVVAPDVSVDLPVHPIVPPPPTRVPQQPIQDNKIRPKPLVDKAFEASPPLAADLPSPRNRTVRTEVFGDEPAQPKQLEKTRTTTGVFDIEADSVEESTKAEPVRPEPRLAGFEDDTAVRRVSPTDVSGKSLMAAGTSGFDSTSHTRAQSTRRRGNPTDRSGISTTAITISSFNNTPIPDRTTAAAGRTVQNGSLGEGNATPRHRPAKQAPAPNPDEPVEIVSKPTPVYTEEARRLRVEGVVLLEVLFEASGQLRVLRVLEGLGHGLDEAAVEATRNIKYKSARLQGRAVDHTATLRIVFQLA